MSQNAIADPAGSCVNVKVATENFENARVMKSTNCGENMKNSKHLFQTLGLVSAVVLGGSLSARATVDMTFTWTGTLYEANYSATYINPADAIGIYAFSSPQLGTPFYSVCLSPAGLLDGNPHTYNELPFGGGGGANPGIYPSNWAWSGPGPNPQYWGIQNAAYLWNTFGMGIVSSGSNQRAAALEFAVWTALYDSSGYGALGHPNNWLAPIGQMDSTTLNYYNQYTAALMSAGSFINTHLYTGNVLESTIAGSGPGSGGSQEFLLLGSPVPEPTTVIAGALLLLPFGASTIRMLRKTRAA
jgi:hypothetical protein